MKLEVAYNNVLAKTNNGKVCPAHEDDHGSLSVNQVEDRILMKCHAGCEFKNIVAALGMRSDDFFEKQQKRTNVQQRETARYRYDDEDGTHLFDVVRMEPPKTFRQQAANGEYSTKKVKKVPFQLQQLRKAVETGKQVLLLEGEKDVLRAKEMGFTATTTPGGAGKWKEQYAKHFKNADTVLIPDLDLPGIKGAHKIASALKDSAKRLRWLQLPDLGEITEKHGKDFSDWCNLQGSDSDLLQEMIDKAPDWKEDEGNAIGKNIPSWLFQSETGRFSILPAIAAKCFVEKSQSSLLFHQSSWWEWNGKIWREVEENNIKEQIRKMFSQNSISLRLTKMNIINDVHEQIRLMLATDDEFKGFDTEEEKIIFLNGTLDRGKVEFREEHLKEDYKTIMLKIEFNPHAKCPRWMSFLNEVDLDPETQDTLQMWCGYLLIPTANLQKCLFLIGEGSNGKGVFLMTLQNMLGPKNCSSLEMAELFDRFKVARLRGKLVNIASDVETSQVLDTRFKKLVAGEPQVAEKKFRDAFEFRPYARLLFSANEFIPTRDRSHGFFRRFDLVKFNRTFREEERDPDLEEKLREELSGIFNWCLVGLKQLEIKNRKITPSEKMKQAHDEFREAVNPLITYAKERLEFLSSEKIEAETLRNNYYEWCVSHGYRALSDVGLGKELKRLYPEIDKKRIMVGKRRKFHYQGVTLN